MSQVFAPVVSSAPRRLLLACVYAACAAGAMAAHAQGAMPPWQGSGAARYVCGGIGSDESTAMRAAMKSHPLSLLFSRPDGAYLANVQVSIRGDAGTLDLRADGPVCIIDLPAGKYTVQATSGGATKSEAVTLGSTPRTVDFRF